MSDDKKYQYLIQFVIDVKRTDNKILTDNENTMVMEMRVATEKAIADVMKRHGNNNSKNLGNKMVVY